MAMRFKPLETPTKRPPEAAAFREPEEKFDFDEGIEFAPERDIGELSITKLRKWLDEARSVNVLNWPLYGERAEMLITLFPSRRHEFKLEEEKLSEELKAFKNGYGRAEEWGAAGYQAKNFAILFPDRRGELSLDEKFFNGLLERLEKLLGKNDFGFADGAIEMAVLFPDRRAEFLNENVEAWFRRWLDTCHQKKNWRGFGMMAAALVMLFPNRKDELPINEEFWKGLKKMLAQYRQAEDWRAFVTTALSLTILAAEDVRITADGRIEITPKKPKLVGESTPLPARSR